MQKIIFVYVPIKNKLLNDFKLFWVSLSCNKNSENWKNKKTTKKRKLNYILCLIY